jgi:predicted nucleic acid-binding protein
MMAGPFVIDASVFLNAFNPMESGSEISKEVLARLQSQSIPVIAPFLLLPETAAAISRGTDSSELAVQFASTLLHLPHLILISLDRALAQQALMIASSHRLRGGDSVYVAVAQRFACPLITLDKEQHDRAANILMTFYPSELLNTLKTG